jgi:cytochrome bd-type quinol oxidase subunit 2
MHPLLALIANRPQLLVDHARAYAALVDEEFDSAFASWRRRAILLVVALFCTLVAAVLAGVAVMLWTVNPGLQTPASWVLLATPLVPLLAAVICLMLARQPTQSDAFANLGRQISADIAMLRAASTP